MAGITGTADAGDGPTKPCVSLAEYAARFGSRAAHITTTDVIPYDSAEFFFREGGSELFVSRTADATEPVLTTALSLFPRDRGPGQVFAPGRTTEPQALILADHAKANNRVAILDAPNSDVVATLTGASSIAGITAASERYAALFAPYITVPGVTSDTTRDIPPSALVAGIMSRNDGLGVSPNEPSAGVNGISLTALDVVESFTDADRETLNANGVNLLRQMYDGVRIYGYRTLADPADATEQNWLLLSNARLFMAIQAELDATAENFVFKQIDGDGRLIARYGGAMTGVLLPWWRKGSLYGSTPEAAFKVDVGPNVNTIETIAAGELRAVIAVRCSPFAEWVYLDMVKTRITETV